MRLFTLELDNDIKGIKQRDAYYDKNMKFFLDANPEVKDVDEITQEVINNFISAQMDKGNRVTAINARLRAVNVFLRYQEETLQRNLR